MNKKRWQEKEKHTFLSEAHTTLVEFNYTNNLFKMKLSSWIKRSKKIFSGRRGTEIMYFLVIIIILLCLHLYFCCGSIFQSKIVIIITMLKGKVRKLDLLEN